MRIADVRVRPFSVPVAKSYVTALEARRDGSPRSHTPNQLLVETDDGLVEYGECCADPLWPRGLNGPAVAAISIVY